MKIYHQYYDEELQRCFVTPEDELDRLSPYMTDWLLSIKFEGEEVFGEDVSDKDKTEEGDVVCLYYLCEPLRLVKVLKNNRVDGKKTNRRNEESEQ